MVQAATRPITQQYGEQVVPGIASLYSRAGRYGSGSMERALSGATEAYGRALGDVTSNIVGQDYARERGLQQQAQLGQRAPRGGWRPGECTHPGRANPPQGWFYDRVGMVDLGGYFWAPAATMLNRIRERVYVPSPQGYDGGRCITYWRWGTWYGVHRDWRTFYVVNRCDWFMAAWAPNGRCW